MKWRAPDVSMNCRIHQRHARELSSRRVRFRCVPGSRRSFRAVWQQPCCPIACARRTRSRVAAITAWQDKAWRSTAGYGVPVPEADIITNAPDVDIT